MAATLLVIALCLALLGWLVWWVRGAWRNRMTDFIHRVPVTGGRPEEVGAAVLDRVLPVLVAGGFSTVAQGGHTTVLELPTSRSWWPIVVAIVFFPIGLVALLGLAGRGSAGSVTLVTGTSILEVRGRCGRLTADYLIHVLDEEAVGYRISA